ncbi:MAG: biotin/lipoyl-binding protein, partial [Oscillospiraceae bacterium]
MRKFVTLILFLSIISGLLAVNYNLSKIKVVQGAHLAQKEYCGTITVSGEFENQDVSEVMLSVPVCIKKVYVKENDFVNAGQILFSIDKEKMEKMFSGQLDKEVLEGLKQEDMSSLSSQNFSAESLYNLSEKIYAGDSGIITQLNVSDNAIALSGRPLCSIIKSDDVMAKFTLSQLDYGKVAVGDEVNISSVAFGNINYNGKISDKNAVVRREATALGSKVVVDVFATIENPDSRIAGGLQINGSIQNGDLSNITVVNYRVIRQDEAGEYVLILADGRAKKEYIKTGIEADNYTQISTY